jgi:hypothetical protein
MKYDWEGRASISNPKDPIHHWHLDSSGYRITYRIMQDLFLSFPFHRHRSNILPVLSKHSVTIFLHVGVPLCYIMQLQLRMLECYVVSTIIFLLCFSISIQYNKNNNNNNNISILIDCTLCYIFQALYIISRYSIFWNLWQCCMWVLDLCVVAFPFLEFCSSISVRARSWYFFLGISVCGSWFWSFGVEFRFKKVISDPISTVAYRGGGLGGSNPPPKFRSFTKSNRIANWVESV